MADTKPPHKPELTPPKTTTHPPSGFHDKYGRPIPMESFDGDVPPPGDNVPDSMKPLYDEKLAKMKATDPRNKK